MNVRAKFSVVEKTQNSSGFKVTLHPVTGGSEENEAFFKYTPAGRIELSTINEAAAESFEVGKAYYVDFSASD
jgi:hypothetical protein